MTGFGRGVATTKHFQLTVEIRSVNHRFLEMSMRFPKEWLEAEIYTKKVLSTYFSRGKLDVFVHLKTLLQMDQTVDINWPFIHAYRAAREKIQQVVPIEDKWSMSELLSLDEALTVQTSELSAEDILEAVDIAVRQAATQLVSMREEEGKALLEVLQQFTQQLATQIAQISDLSMDAVQKYRQRLLDRLNEIAALDVVEDRLLAEVAVFAEKAEISEELDRLSSHMKQLQETLQQTDPIGRKLDFLMQEMHREINTIGSKNQSMDASICIVQAKTILEKMREQVQNIE